MANTWGENIKITIFGESHGAAIGVVFDGLPSGFALDMEEISREMARRAPGNDEFSTPRKEADEVEILSGVSGGKTNGSALCGIIRNTNVRSGDYQSNLLRPGHADFTAFLKYGSVPSGGGQFSGRITAPLVFAGAVAKQILREHNIFVNARITQIGGVSGTEAQMKAEIIKAKDKKNSVGGIIECAVTGDCAGLGAPFFGSVESKIAVMMFSIPAVKGVEFGAGFGFAAMTGIEANDELYVDGGKIKTRTNNNGGVNGGISNGMPIVFRAVIKPTPSVELKQSTVDINEMKDTEIEVKGRHDPCIVPRAVAVVEAGAALCVLDLLGGR